MTFLDPFPVPAELAGQTLAAVLRARLPGTSWTQVRDLIAARRARVLGELCLDPVRRLKAGDTVELLRRSAAKPHEPELLTIRYLDEHVVVVEKPSGMCTVRHPSERDWNEQRKALSPTLEDLVPKLITRREGKFGPPMRLRVVHRLDKETSGLVVFARTVPAERGLGKQFHAHTVVRRYLAVVAGRARPGRIETMLIRDRGDGRRGSATVDGVGKQAITHVEIVERLPGYTLVGCRLETGRTHPVRIHLAEQGHPVCGDKGVLSLPRGHGDGRRQRGRGWRHAHQRVPPPGWPPGDALGDAAAGRLAGVPSAAPRPSEGPPMPIEIQWTENPDTGERRIIAATKFANEWAFKWKRHRRDDWTKGLTPTRARLGTHPRQPEARYRRREGSTTLTSPRSSASSATCPCPATSTPRKKNSPQRTQRNTEERQEEEEETRKK
ncbi:MAG: RluA family pseudouridine synthase [Gemmataceae bacterium]